MQESDELIELFNKNFHNKKNEPIVLYGLGYRTEIIINNLKGYNIVGLMDSNSSGYKSYGIDVLSKNEVINITKTIILVCIYNSAKIIYKNIYDLEKNYGISIYHISGKKMNISDLNNNDDDNNIQYENISIDLIKQEINKYDIISFDIFDTLITRKLYQIGDIFLILQNILEQSFDIKCNFTEYRILSEKEAYKLFGEKTNIDNIYNIIGNKIKLSENLILKIKNLEIEIEKLFIIKREDIVELLEYAKNQNKQVILVSDMYFNKYIIHDILNNSGINFDGDIIVSCDIGKSKINGNLWEYIKNTYKDKNILHIGDNKYSDVEQPRKYSINSIHLKSCIHNFEVSNIRNYFKNFNLNLGERIILGHFISYLFNSPFTEYINGKIKIYSKFKIGYLFFGPLIYNFMLKLIQKSQDNNVSKILFISRDGYLLNILYEKYFKQKNIENIYFYTSRRALYVSSIIKEDDIINNINILYKFGIKTNISFNNILDDRFGVQVKENDIYNNKNLKDFGSKENFINHIINNYKYDILENSYKERKEYMEYIKKLNISDNDVLLFINCNGGGNTQYFLDKLFKNTKYFLYFFTTNKIKYLENISKTYSLYVKELDELIEHHYISDNNVYEPIFTSPDGQFVKFENGNPIFDYDLPNRYENKIKEIHEGVEYFVQELSKINNIYNNIICNDNFILQIFSIFASKQCINIDDDIKKSFIFLDKIL